MSVFERHDRLVADLTDLTEEVFGSQSRRDLPQRDYSESNVSHLRG
jgi:hypothetical protein